MMTTLAHFDILPLEKFLSQNVFKIVCLFRPTFSQTILLQNLYINPQNSAKTADGSHLANVTDEEMQVGSRDTIKGGSDKIMHTSYVNLSDFT